MIAASFYEGYLERKYRLMNEAEDLELAHNDANHKNVMYFFDSNLKFT